jgi:hypothetical protein
MQKQNRSKMRKYIKYGLALLAIVVSAIALVAPELFEMPFVLVEPGYAIAGFVAVNVKKPGPRDGVGNDTHDKITIFKWDDVLVPPKRDDKGVVITNSIVMKPGAYMIYIYATRNTIVSNTATEGDADSMALKHSVAFTHPGTNKAVRELLAAWTNENLGVITKKCTSAQKNLYGDPCHPLQMKGDLTDDASKAGYQITLEGVGTTSIVPGIYEGIETYPEPLAVIGQDDDSPSVEQGEGQYQLSENTVATQLLTLDNAQHGMSYTLVGAVGANPSFILEGSDFLLKDGASWFAAAESQITFRAFKDGAASYKFIEMSRT